MRYFKDSNGVVFGYEKVDQKRLIATAIKNGMKEITGSWPPKPTLAEIKLQYTAAIEVDYQKLLDAGVTYSGALFQSDTKSIATLSETLTAVANGWSLPAAFAWIDSANKAHPANLAFLKGLSVAMANHKSALFSRLYAAKSKINVAKTAKASKAVTL